MTHMNPHFKLNSVISSISRPKPRRKRTKRSVEEFGSDLLHWSIDRQLTNASPWKQKPKQKRTARQTLCALCGQTFINAPHNLPLLSATDVSFDAVSGAAAEAGRRPNHGLWATARASAIPIIGMLSVRASRR